MRKILLASHGNLAKGMKNTVEFFVGKDGNISVVSAYEEGDDSDYRESIKMFLEELTAADEGIVFTDLIGGSVNQEVMKLAHMKNNVWIISNMNLAIILSVLLFTEQITEMKLKKLVEESQVNVAEVTENTSLYQEDCFFD